MDNKTNDIEYQIDVPNNKALAIELFSKIVALFDELGIDYWIEYGTMLGAVREKGFIPWDSEFDVGVWNSDYQKHREHFENQFISMGFYLNFEAKDRIKLVHKDLLIGAYTIDIHTYHIKNDVAYVSFNRRKLKLVENMHNAFKLYDKRSEVAYPIAGMIKSFLAHGKEIPSQFTFKKGPVRSPKSYILKLGEYVIDNSHDYAKGMSSSRKIAVKAAGVIFSILPDGVKYLIADYVKKKSFTIDRTHSDIQAIPSHFYQDLALIQFETIMVRAPREAVHYVESVYGPNWHVRQHNWINSQNQINKEIGAV